MTQLLVAKQGEHGHVCVPIFELNAILHCAQRCQRRGDSLLSTFLAWDVLSSCSIE